MEAVEWENEGDSMHEKVVRFAWKCVAWGVERWRSVDGVVWVYEPSEVVNGEYC